MTSDEIEMKDVVLAEKFSLIMKDVNYEVDVGAGKQKKMKQILSNINAYCKSSELTAIMGPSGAGIILIKIR